jgi:hypothetical protein
MNLNARDRLFRLALIPLAAVVLVATGCTSSMSTATQSSAVTGSTFVVGTDAPAPFASVVSFQVQVESVQLVPAGGGTPVSMISGTPTVDFARYNGLQTLLDMNDVPVGQYGSVIITLNSTGTIGYLVTGAGAPTISTMPATISPASVTVTLNRTLNVVNGGSPVGLRVDFDLAQSIGVTNGAINGNVDPAFDVRTVARTDTGAYIDELAGGVVSVDQTAQSFVIQGPHGENFTINTNGQTEWDGAASLSTLTTSSIVQVSGQLDPADQTLDADEVAVFTDSRFYATGQITYVNPPPPATGAASSFDLYVRALEPADISGSTGMPISLGQIAQVNLQGTEKYDIYWMHNPLTQFLFNSSALVAGQDVAIGGPDTGITAGTPGLTVNRIHLRNWGFNGTVVASSRSSANGTFQMTVNGFAGVLIPETITVYLGPRCDFRYGFGAFNDLANATSIRVVGLLLRNPANGNVVLIARHVDGLDFTDFTTAAWQQ